ncbi:roadblock/LC7 domain-containing protein [Micromonospora chalcea]
MWLAEDDQILERSFLRLFTGRRGINQGLLTSRDGLLFGAAFGLSDDAAERLAAMAASVVGASQSVPQAFALDWGGDRHPFTVITTAGHHLLMYPVTSGLIGVLLVAQTTGLRRILIELAELRELQPSGRYRGRVDWR